MIDIGTPPQVHTFKNLIWELKSKGHEVLITAREYQMVIELLTHYGLEYHVVRSSAKDIFTKIAMIPYADYVMDKLAREFKPDIMVSFGSPYLAHVSAILKVPHIAFEDTELSPEQFILYAPFTDVICTPEAFSAKISPKKHIRFKGYKELAYLHPNRYKPDDNLFSNLQIDKHEKYVILRFNAFGASHDIGRKGFNLADKRLLVKTLENYARVLISSEVKIPDDLEKYRFTIPLYMMHDALFFATLLVGDTQTSTTEAACLGTPAIRSNSFVGPKDMSNFIELEKKYNLIYNISNPKDAIEMADKFIHEKDIKIKWHEKTKLMLKDKIDVTAFMLWFIEEYPNSFRIMKENPDYQTRFI